MKNLLLLFVLSMILRTAPAQIKILFDASKAETAGNADWVIDADLHNLVYNSNGTVSVSGTSNQSNAQRTPTPAQSGITAATAETYWSGGLSYWGVDCVKKGYAVETLPYNGIISYGNASNPQDLSNYKVFIVCEPNMVFTMTEKQAILNFVQNGGGLFMIADHTISDRNNDGWDSPEIWNDLMTNNGMVNNPFGISFDLADFSETSSNIALPADSIINGSMGAASQIKWSGGTSITINTSANSSAKGVVYKTGSSFNSTNIMVAKARYGSGKIVAFGDSSPCDDGTGDPNDNLFNGYTGDVGVNHQRILMNATIWLATANIVTGINDIVQQGNALTVFPNPVRGAASIHFTLSSVSDVDITMSDVSGKLLRKYSLGRHLPGLHQQMINCAGLAPGVYFLRVKMLGGFITRKVIVN